ncbi:uncharacterized protein LOC110677205 [Aedes aegypti]|uniref:Uncharacterized protein n=1 Tax=Aedes aegypti TaxID=7159 RepID=A0A6I8U014_AEDAE|nr:uncharacterized protein LOC110677205 [Aedes aegypti]
MFVTKDFGFGSSGSPFYLEGEPVGLYGYGFQYNGKYHSIVTTYEQDPSQVHLPGIDLTSTVQRTFIDWHPGKGKTRKYIVEETLKNVELKRHTLILTPTRVVMEEVRKAFGETEFKIGTNVAYCKNNAVTIACHATFMDFVKSRGVGQIKVHTIMMDECHFLDPMSIAARGVMDYLNIPSNAGINVVYLSATPPGQAPSVGSNYTIREYAAPSTRKLSSEWFESIVRQHGAGKTIAFVPSQDQSERFADSSAGAVSLHRDNFEENYAKALDPETKIIYSTEISEMGANYNVDLVIDLRTAVKPVIQSEDEVILRKQPITTSSMVQRRGRTGQNAPGTYVYPVDAATKEDPYDWVCWLEAQMVLDQLSRMWRTEAHASQPSGAVFRGLAVEVRKGYLEDHIVNFLGLMLCLQVISNARPR